MTAIEVKNRPQKLIFSTLTFLKSATVDSLEVVSFPSLVFTSFADIITLFWITNDE